VAQPFDRAFYERYYFDPRTAVTSRQEMRERARLIAAFAGHFGVPVRRVLDAGCGIGLLRSPLARLLPRAEYTGIEVSEYLCRRYGWEQASLETYRATRPFDLVICYDVLQYLDERAAARALANLRHLCRGVLYLTALTLGDFRRNCDRSRTDPHVHLRPGEWYRRRVQRHFREVGAGFWVRRGAPIHLWELEAAPPGR
jgi:SAM-dependent methyltransferase